jgi:predicted nucleotidyltransferase
MATVILPQDFKDFLKSLNSKGVEYLLIGGYAVNYYGHARATADMDIWIAVDPDNAQRMCDVIQDFFGQPIEGVSRDMFMQQNKVLRFGFPPIRIEVVTTIDGLEFPQCHAARVVDVLDGVPVNLIALEHLKINRKASGRSKDLTDLEFLE